MSRLTFAVLCAGLTACPSPAPPIVPPPDATDSAPPAPVIDGGSLHSYTCPVSDGGAAWSCQDGVSVPVGTCAKFGCVPVGP